MTFWRSALVGILVLGLGLPGAATAAGKGNPMVLLSTSMGDIKVELYPDKAPVTVKNFLDYVKAGYYNGTIFHRVIPGFMIQGGGLTADMQDKREGQMCARGTFSVCMPVSVAEVVKATFRAARAAAKRWLSAGECLVALAEHFVETWSARRARPRIRRARRPRSESRPCAA